MIRKQNDSFYSNPQNVLKRNEYYREKKRLKECGVILSQDKPWYCGEIDNCCYICRKCFKHNAVYKKSRG